MNKKIQIATLSAALFAGLSTQVLLAEEVELQPVSIYKTSACAVSQGWLDSLRGAGIDVSVDVTETVPEMQRNFGVPSPTECYIGVAGDYFLNGEVPVSIVTDLLERFPGIRGVSAEGDTVTTHD